MSAEEVSVAQRTGQSSYEVLKAFGIPKAENRVSKLENGERL